MEKPSFDKIRLFLLIYTIEERMENYRNAPLDNNPAIDDTLRLNCTKREQQLLANGAYFGTESALSHAVADIRFTAADWQQYNEFKNTMQQLRQLDARY